MKSVRETIFKNLRRPANLNFCFNSKVRRAEDRVRTKTEEQLIHQDTPQRFLKMCFPNAVAHDPTPLTPLLTYKKI
jgi:hypothetical protein